MRRHCAIGVAIVVVLAGCGGRTKLDLKGTAGGQIKHAADIVVPTSILDLTVAPEDVTKTVQNSQRAYVDSLVLYGLRKDALLQATFQVSRFNAGANFSNIRFRQSVVVGIGNETPITLDVAGQTVYLTGGNRQRISIWFKGQYFFVLAVRQDYPTPRNLLRQLLAVNP